MSNQYTITNGEEGIDYTYIPATELNYIIISVIPGKTCTIQFPPISIDSISNIQVILAAGGMNGSNAIMGDPDKNNGSNGKGGQGGGAMKLDVLTTNTPLTTEPFIFEISCGSTGTSSELTILNTDIILETHTANTTTVNTNSIITQVTSTPITENTDFSDINTNSSWTVSTQLLSGISVGGYGGGGSNGTYLPDSHDYTNNISGGNAGKEGFANGVIADNSSNGANGQKSGGGGGGGYVDTDPNEGTHIVAGKGGTGSGGEVIISFYQATITPIQGLIGSDYTITTSTTGYLYTFYSDQPSFTFDKSYSIQYVVVNGGSGGNGSPVYVNGKNDGGNGGSGGAVIYDNMNVLFGNDYSLTIGPGGEGGWKGSATTQGGFGGAGGISEFDNISPINAPASGGTGTNNVSSNQNVLAGTIGSDVMINNIGYKFGGGGCGGTSGNTTQQPVPESVLYGGAGITYGSTAVIPPASPNSGGGGSGGGAFGTPPYYTAGTDGAAGVVMIFVMLNSEPKPNMIISSDTVTSGETTTNSSIEFNFTSSETTTDFTIDDIVATNGTITNLSGSGTDYTATFTTTSGGTCSVTVPANVYNNNGIVNTESIPFTWTYQYNEIYQNQSITAGFYNDNNYFTVKTPLPSFSFENPYYPGNSILYSEFYISFPNPYINEVYIYVIDEAGNNQYIGNINTNANSETLYDANLVNNISEANIFNVLDYTQFSDSFNPPYYFTMANEPQTNEYWFSIKMNDGTNSYLALNFSFVPVRMTILSYIIASSSFNSDSRHNEVQSWIMTIP